MNAELARGAANRVCVRLRENQPAAPIMRVLDSDQTGRREHHVAGRLDGGQKLRRCEQAFGSDGGELHACIRSARARLVPHHVSFMTKDHVVARAREKLEPDLVGHGAARHKERALLQLRRKSQKKLKAFTLWTRATRCWTSIRGEMA